MSRLRGYGDALVCCVIVREKRSRDGRWSCMLCDSAREEKQPQKGGHRAGPEVTPVSSMQRRSLQTSVLVLRRKERQGNVPALLFSFSCQIPTLG